MTRPGGRPRLVLLGAPGAGKGTLAAALCDHFDICHLSSGELLRDHVDAKTDLGRQVASYLDQGELAPDDLVTAAVVDALTRIGPGYVLDGFPRTATQARQADSLQAGGIADAVVFLALPDHLARQRLADRRTEGRSDDQDPAVVEHRLQQFHAETEPLAGYYRERGLLLTVDASPPPDEVTAAALAALSTVDPP